MRPFSSWNLSTLDRREISPPLAPYANIVNHMYAGVPTGIRGWSWSRKVRGSYGGDSVVVMVKAISRLCNPKISTVGYRIVACCEGSRYQRHMRMFGRNRRHGELYYSDCREQLLSKLQGQSGEEEDSGFWGTQR